jgi:hypothetical protein
MRKLRGQDTERFAGVAYPFHRHRFGHFARHRPRPLRGSHSNPPDRAGDRSLYPGSLSACPPRNSAFDHSRRGSATSLGIDASGQTPSYVADKQKEIQDKATDHQRGLAVILDLFLLVRHVTRRLTTRVDAERSGRTGDGGMGMPHRQSVLCPGLLDKQKEIQDKATDHQRGLADYYANLEEDEDEDEEDQSVALNKV